VPETPPPRNWTETLLGLALLIVILVVLGFVGRAIYAAFAAPSSVEASISAYFVDDSGKPLLSLYGPGAEHGHLKIQGTMYQSGQPLKSGTVLITVATANNSFRQSVLATLTNGVFQTEDPAFFSIRPGVEADIRADVNVQGTRQSTEIHLNGQSPIDKSVLGYGLAGVVVLLGVVFFLAFTGRKTKWRNQTAIIFSYVIIALFLAVPILAPVLLIQIFPTAMYKMIGAPAGLLNTHTPSQDAGQTQWALNIGGYSYEMGAPAVTVPAAPAPAVIAPNGGATSASTGATGTAAAPGPTGQTGDQSKPDTTGAQVSHGAGFEYLELKPPTAIVEGGLVIPLYVIILSVIGGAINMTRKVPRLQGQGEESNYTTGRPVSSLGSFAMAKMGLKTATPEDVVTEPDAKPPEAPLEDQAQDIEKKLEPLITEEVMRKADSDQTIADIRSLVGDMQDLYNSRKAGEQLLKFNSFEDWTVSHPRLAELLGGSWRVELLNQYMYLISAPFLAIVTYYVLDLLGLSKQGVVVVLSFSVGLISEKIVSWILGIASGYMSSDPKKA
jgi:hypothetical protein